MVAGAQRPRGKSELHRAGCWVTPSGGDSKESATEIDCREKRRWWKGEVRAHQRLGDLAAV